MKLFVIVATALLLVATTEIHEGFGWSAECVTTWNGSSWDECIDGAICTADGWATCAASAPACNHECESRGARAGHYGIQDAYAPLIYAVGRDCEQDCAVDHWEATASTPYWVRAWNNTSYQECGPTKGKIMDGWYNCNQL